MCIHPRLEHKLKDYSPSELPGKVFFGAYSRGQTVREKGIVYRVLEVNGLGSIMEAEDLSQQPVRNGDGKNTNTKLLGIAKRREDIEIQKEAVREFMNNRNIMTIYLSEYHDFK